MIIRNYLSIVSFRLLLVPCFLFPLWCSAESHNNEQPAEPTDNHLAAQQPAPLKPELFGQAIPGGVAVVPIQVAESSKPIARFGSRDLLIVHHREHWLALVGLSPAILPGNYVVSTFSEQGDPGSEEFSVLARAPKKPKGQSRLLYNDKENDTEQGISIPLAEFVEAGAAEANPSIRVLDTSDMITYSTSAPNLDFSPLTESLDLVPYGTLLDGNRMHRHDYISYLTHPGAQVYAPADGIVKAMESDDKDGTTLYLDHGQGLFSILGNLKQPLVEVDQLISRGEQLATAGDNGNSGLAQVDWALQLNGWLVDPAAVAALGVTLQTEQSEQSEVTD